MAERTERGPKKPREFGGLVAKDVRIYRALEMRMEGHSYSEIAKELEVPLREASNFVKDALEELRGETLEKVDEMRQLELARLDDLLLAHWVNRSHPRHADVILKLQERRAKLAGLDVPQIDLNDSATALRNFIGAAMGNIGVAPVPPAQGADADPSEGSEGEDE